MPRQDRFGYLGPKRDRAALPEPTSGYGQRHRIHRLDGSTVDYVYTAGGWRMVPGKDTRANAKAEVERDLAALAAAERAAAYDAEAQREADRRKQLDAQRDAEDKRTIEHQREQTQGTVEGLQRAARWARKPIAPANNGSSGGNVASIEETRAAIMSAVEKMNEGLGAVQQAHASTEEAQGQLQRATEGSGQSDVSEANGLLAQAVNSLEEVRQQVSAAISASEGVANRL